MKTRSFIRRIIGRIMFYWIDYRAQKRKAADEKLMTEMLSAMKSQGNAAPQWERFLQRLRAKFTRQFREELDRLADQSSESLFHAIINADRCNLHISPEEKRGLYEQAFDRSQFIRRGLFFAHLLHGKRLPLNVTLQVATRMHTSLGFFGCQDEDVKVLLEEIERSDEQAVEELAGVLASMGLYRRVKEMFSILQKPIPLSTLCQCKEAYENGKLRYFRDAVEVCIRLEDWDWTKQLIEEWKEEEKGREFAGELALRLYFAQQEEVPAI